MNSSPNTHNQMRDAIRRKPMTATATAAVRKIWQTYFTVAQNEAERQQLEQGVFCFLLFLFVVV